MHLTNKTFDEMEIGQTQELRRLITADDLYVFANVSGNYNPMHLPEWDGDGDGHAESVAPGMYIASLISAVLGTSLPGPGIIISQTIHRIYGPRLCRRRSRLPRHRCR